MSETRRRCLNLVKGPHRFVFRYWPGQESDLLAVLVEMASDDASPLDWFDAAVLSFRMGQWSEPQLDPAV